MKTRFVIAITLLSAPLAALAQSKTTEALEKRHSDARTLFFYHNTLRMLNQAEDEAFDAMIRDIEKMKFLMIRKRGSEDYRKLVSDYKSEKFEEMMTSRFEGKNFDVFMRDGNDRGMLVLINDDENLFVLDIVGSIALDKVTSLYEKLDESSDIGPMISAFMKNGDDGDEKDEKGKN